MDKLRQVCAPKMFWLLGTDRAVPCVGKCDSVGLCTVRRYTDSSGTTVVQVSRVWNNSCSGQPGLEQQLFRSDRSGKTVVQVRPVWKNSCSGQTGLEQQLFRSARSRTTVVQVSPAWNNSCSG
jgi:hypothetical protein